MEMIIYYIDSQPIHPLWFMTNNIEINLHQTELLLYLIPRTKPASLLVILGSNPPL